ncbi:glutamyl-tRNA reductase [Halorubrum salipaludis]|uniref:Glutamyl-tRNA reductase n=1 Tax=Halorubrum salipaludis TaxID=2032630 RepID=A0A2A2FD04_9EURY|nr:glutamyl-tRNA reductase [Halorubrum salipaludis]PAU82557.1 glutamyl-tRNA reductase [Halorubrum salipaludis]
MSTDRSEGAVVRSETDPEGSEPSPDPEPERTESSPDSEPEPSESPPDPERLRRRLRRRTDEIERREVEAAVSALDARGGLTEEQRETVRELGSALADELIAGPDRTLERAARDQEAEGRERERTRSIRRLFDLGEA